MYSTVSEYVNHACEILILHFPVVLAGNFLTTDVLSEFHCVLMCIEQHVRKYYYFRYVACCVVFCVLQGLQAQQAAQPAAQQAGPQPGAATQNGQPDYSAQWAEYYRSIGKVKEAEAIEAQMKAAKVK